MRRVHQLKMKNKGLSTMRYFMILALLVTVVGCTTSVYSLSEEERQGLVEQTYNYPMEEVFSASQNILTKEGWVIENANQQAGLITTTWQQNEDLGSQVMIGNMRAKTSISLNEVADGQTFVRVNIQMQIEDESGSWEQRSVTKSYAENEIQPFLERIEEVLGDN